jgi:hypothetical protein
MVHQGMGDRLGRGADVEKERGAVGDVAHAARGDGGLCGIVQAAPVFVADIGDGRLQHRAAVHAFQLALCGQFGQVAPHRLQRHVEMRCQRLDRHPPIAARDAEDLGQAHALRHGGLRAAE